MRAIDALRLVGGGSAGTPVTNFVTVASSVSFDITSTNATTLTVDWGDGSAPEDFAMTGSKVDVDKNYSSGGTRIISFSGTGNVPMLIFTADNNGIISANVLSNTSLTTLQLASNDLTVLNISTNTALINLYCYDNCLTLLDISTNTALINLQCRDNNLPTSEINKILADLVSAGLSGAYTLFCQNQTPSAPPTGQGITDATTLRSRGWTVTTD